MTIKQELLALKSASPAGLLHPREAVEWARSNPASALHRALDWDDPHAAENWRIWQVRQLITMHVVNDDGEPQIVSLSIDRKGSGGYRSIDDVVTNRNLSEIMLADALAELERVRLKYARVEALTSIWKEVEQVQTRARRRRAPAQPEARP